LRSNGEKKNSTFSFFKKKKKTPQEPEAPDAVAPSFKFEGEAKGMRQQVRE